MKTNFKPHLIALIILIIVYWSSASIFYENQKLTEAIISKAKRYPAHFITLVIVFIIGFWGLKKLPPNWLRSIWTLVYFCLIVTMLVVGFIDYFIYRIDDLSFRNLISGLHLFFASPVPYGIMLLIAKKVNQSNKV